MSQEKLVSVIIPAYNAKRWIDRAIQSVMAQTHAHWELIVVDDGSTDGTDEHVRARYPVVTVLRKENGGVASARNIGARAANGEYLAFLDADDVWAPMKTELQLQAVKDFPHWGLCGTRRIDIRPGEEVRWGSTSRESVLHGHLSFFGNNPLTTSSALLKRVAFFEEGGFDERLHHVEDYDLWLRVSRHWDVVILNAPLVGYQSTPGSLCKDLVSMRDGRLAVLRKWSDEYPNIVRPRIKRAYQSMVRNLIRTGRQTEARKVFFANVREDSSLGQLHFVLIDLICRANVVFNRKLRG